MSDNEIGTGIMERLLTSSKNNLLLGVERMSEAQCSSPSTPGGDLTADEPQYDWRTRHDSYLKYLYVENPPKSVWNGEEWIPETNA